MPYTPLYEFDQIVFFVGTKIEEMRISGVKISHQKGHNANYIYTLGCDYDRNELDLYATKEEAAEAWLRKQGLDCGLSNI